jgi:hypothetical protein
METLRAFVKAVTQGIHRGVAFDTKAESKPDYLSPTLELRRMAVPGEERAWAPGDWVSTDFYELYWAHLMAGTAWRHVTAWASALLLHRRSAVPARLRKAWAISWAAVLLAAAAAVVVVGPAGPGTTAEWSLLGVTVVALKWLGRSAGNFFGLKYVGDAARYLSATPENVGVRQAIRSAAVDLLTGLHDDPTWRRYHRIIVVGHSLGSVIAYDAMTHFWQRRHRPTVECLRSEDRDARARYEQLRASDKASIEAARDVQSTMWREQRRMGVQWKITDFVTLGSPLAHAPFLMANSPGEFEERVRQREYPSCPPQPNDIRDQLYGRPLLTVQAGTLLHHGALFACTRWTNLHFERDLIGGPIEKLGGWIDNQRLDPRGFFPHTKYWSAGADHRLLLESLDLVGWWTTAENAATAVETQQRDSEALRQRP